MIRAAVVLAGCGVMDGSEIHEAVSILIHLSRRGVTSDCFAPDQSQMHVVDHLRGQPVPAEKRNILVESARIARGKVAPLERLRARDYDAVFFPGGYGAAKNLCDFATKGADCEVHPQVRRVVAEFHEAGKPVGMCCIAPVIAAKVLGTGSGGPGCRVTIGSDPGVASAVAAMGATNVPKEVHEVCLDEANRLATAPAYMCDAPIHQVFDGIGAMVEGALSMVRAAVGAAR